MNLFDLKKDGGGTDKRVYYLVYHPMVVESEENALKSIGGLRNFAKSVQDRRSLMLKLQPSNEYHAGVFNDRPKCSRTNVQLVIKYQRNKRTGAVRTVCMGTVKQAFHYNCLTDFQFLPVSKLENSENFFQDLVPRMIPRNLTDALCWWDRPTINDDTPGSTFFPPYIYSRYTRPFNRLLTPEEISMKEVENLEGEVLAVNRRPERKSCTVIVQANDPFPDGPTEEAIEEITQRCRPREPHDLLTALFERRPMWTRPAVLAETLLEDGLLKAILPKFAFYIISGPFGRCWCRFGYDPRKDPEAKGYQTVAVSFRANEHIPEKIRLKICGRSSDLKKPFMDAMKVDYRFTSGSLPHARQMWYCVCDIGLPIATEIMSKDVTTIVPLCDPNYGWLPPDIIDALRDAIKADVGATMTMLREAEPDELPEELQYYAEETGLEDIF